MWKAAFQSPCKVKLPKLFAELNDSSSSCGSNSSSDLQSKSWHSYFPLFCNGIFKQLQDNPRWNIRTWQNHMEIPELMSPHFESILYRTCQRQRLGFSLDVEVHSAKTTNWWHVKGGQWSWQQDMKTQGRQSLNDTKTWTWKGVKVMQVRRITCG